MPAAALTGKKYIVVMIKDGGEDTRSAYLHRNATLADQIHTLRPNVGFDSTEIGAMTGTLTADWMLHPQLNPLKDIYDEGEMALIHRTGPMFSNLAAYTLQQVREASWRSYTGPIQFPVGLVDHSDQQLTSVSMITRDFVDQFGVPRRKQESGFIGRMTTRFTPFVSDQVTPFASPPTLPMVYHLGSVGMAVNLIGRNGLVSSAKLPPAVTGRYNRALENVNGSQTLAITGGYLDAIMAVPQADPRREFWRAKCESMRTSVAFIQPPIEATVASGSYAVDSSFTAAVTGVGSDPKGYPFGMRTVARLIEHNEDAAAPGLPTRTVFVLNYGSYDTHSAQGQATGQLADKFKADADACVAFRNAMLALDPTKALWNNIVVIDHSEFGRTLVENGAAGTDHAWDRVTRVFGGAVNGGMYGTPATDYTLTTYNTAGVVSSGSSDAEINGNEAGKGTHFPLISNEQLWRDLLRWFGADDSDLTFILPRHAEFGASPAFITP